MAESKQKRPSPDFAVRLHGSGVRPWLVPFTVLSTTLRAVQRLMEPELPDHEVPQLAADEYAVSLQLMDVKSSSAAYKFSSSDPGYTRSVLAELGESIRNPERSTWGEHRLNSINDLSSIAKQLGCQVEIRDLSAPRSNGILAVIKPNTYDNIQNQAFIHGPTSVLGRVLRVGGATGRRCALRVQAQPDKVIYCDVESDRTIRELGQYIYRDVIVFGNATWWSKSWKLKTIAIQSFEEARAGSIRKALDRIYEAGGFGWDEVGDPGSEIAKMRG